MKKLFFVFILLLSMSIGQLSGQVIYHRTHNPNIGFGKSDSKQNQFMDFCVNGPLVGDDNMPVGGYIDTGFVAKNWLDPEIGGGNFSVDNAIFGLGADGNMYMFSYTEKSKLPKMRWAFQNGPVLVKNYVNTRGTSQSKFARSGIGFKEDGTIVVIVSITPVTFYEFANLFIQENCSNAIYLVGGPYVGCSDKNFSYGTMAPAATKLQFYNN